MMFSLMFSLNKIIFFCEHVVNLGTIGLNMALLCSFLCLQHWAVQILFFLGMFMLEYFGSVLHWFLIVKCKQQTTN